MPTKPKKPAEAQPIQPEPQPLTPQQKQATEDKFEGLRCKLLGELIAAISDLSTDRLEMIQTFNTILDREQGCTTPVETFIDSLVMHYWHADKQGKGLTIEEIRFQMEQHAKEEDLRDTLETAYFLTDRYPRPQAHAEDNS